MTDLEMTKLCAEAMGIEQRWYPHGDRPTYDPLCDDAQAMALLKKFKLQAGWYSDKGDEDVGDWSAYYSAEFWADSKQSLNHAIVECVAKVQAAHT